MYESTQKIKLIIAEDNHLFRTSLKAELQRNECFDVIADVEDGKSAVDLARELRPDVVLMDLGLPVMDGIEATRKIKENNADVKVIELTSHSDEEEAMLTLSIGASAYVRKDILGKYLVMIIETVNKGAVWMDPLIGNQVLAKLR